MSTVYAQANVSIRAWAFSGAMLIIFCFGCVWTFYQIEPGVMLRRHRISEFEAVGYQLFMAFGALICSFFFYVLARNALVGVLIAFHEDGLDVAESKNILYSDIRELRIKYHYQRLLKRTVATECKVVDATGAAITTRWNLYGSNMQREELERGIKQVLSKNPETKIIRNLVDQ